MAGGGEAADASIPPGLAELSPQDRELALNQKVCPVSGEKLGAMGAPIKLNVAGHDVFICCRGCREPLEKDPAKYLAKLGIQPTAM
jgi:YHS domain-containing protein